MPRANRRQLDLLIIGLARSGTTLLTNLCTNPARSRLCLAEPRLTTRRAYRPEKQDYFRALGFPDPITTATVADRLFTQSSAGIKEVRARHIRAAITRYDPKRIVIMTRDARAALASYHEKDRRRDNPRRAFPARLFLQTAPLLLQLLEREHRRCAVVRYEDFVADPAVRDDLGRQLGWPLDGDLNLYKSLSRAGEAEKHNNAISTRSLTRPTPTDPATLATLTPILDKLANYQSAFDYPNAWDEPFPPRPG
jgi:hypothetical protein